MMKTVIAAAAFVVVAAASAIAQDAPAASPEDCLKVAFEIAQAAEAKNLGNAELDKVEEMLTKMEAHCDAKQFSEAAAVATDLKTLISKQ